MGKKNDPFYDIMNGLGKVAEVITNAAIKEEKRRQWEREQREIEIEAKKRLIVEARQRQSLDEMSEELKATYIRQFKREPFDEGRLLLASALVKADTKLDEGTLLEIARTFTMSYSRSEFMNDYYPKLKKLRIY